MKNRSFGVELEFDSNGLGTNGVGDLLYNNGVNREWYGNRSKYTDYYGEEYTEYDEVSEDGSEIELRSPILQGAKGFKELKEVVNILNKAGCYTTNLDGLHVHHDAPDFKHDKDLTVKLLKSWKYNEQQIAMFIEENRRNASLNQDGYYNNSPCPTFEYNQITNLEQRSTRNFPDDLYTPFNVRNNLNISALRSHGSIEFRFHEGTLDWNQIEAWIRFGQSFLNGVKARKNPIMPTENPVILMNRLKVNKRTKIQLAKKAGLVLA